MRWRGPGRDWRGIAAPTSEARKQLLEDVREAEKEWRLAMWHFDNAVGEDLVDYAIHCLEAAEKKLDMLYRQAKHEWRPTAGKGGEAG